MSETLEHHPSERELALSAPQRHVAFHRDIEAKAAALRPPLPRPVISISPEAMPAETDPPLIPSAIVDRIGIIQKLTCEAFQLTGAEIRSVRKDRAACIARQVAMYLCKKLTAHSYPTIGRRFGNRDHSTVINACKRVADIIAMPSGSSAGVQTPPVVCDLVREKTAYLLVAIVNRFPEMGS